MHRRESIMQAVQTAITGLTTTGANVERSRAWPVKALPALTLAQGQDNRITDGEDLTVVTRELTVDISVHTQGGLQQETDLNNISAEVYAALTADRTLGLAYVYDLNVEGESAPDIEAENDQTTGRMLMQFSVIYDHSETSAEG